jgi:hypothetical protein
MLKTYPMQYLKIILKDILAIGLKFRFPSATWISSGRPNLGPAVDEVPHPCSPTLF